MRFISSLLFALVVGANAQSQTGTRGGGDPDAVNFLLKLTTVGEWVLKSDIGISDADSRNIFDTSKRISKAMDNSESTSISMVEEELRDDSGAIKIAIYSINPLKISVNRSRWNSLNEEDQYVTAALELFGISGLANRYSVAGMLKQNLDHLLRLRKVSDQNWSYESAIKVGGVVSYKLPGIYFENGTAYYMAVNLKDMDADFDTQTSGRKMATEFCKALGHEKGLSVAFYKPAAGMMGAFFNQTQGYIGIRQVVSNGYQPDLWVENLNCQ